MSCQACAPELIETLPSDFAPGKTYFQEGTQAQPCTNCQALAQTTPPDLAAGGGQYFEPAPVSIFPPASIYNDAQTVSCPNGGPSATVPANTVSVFVANSTPTAVALAKQQANALALSMAQAQLNITGGAISDAFCGGRAYSKSFCVPPASKLTVTAGSLPTGLQLSTDGNVTGLLFGTPTIGGNFTVTATPPAGSPVVYTFSLTVLTITNPGTLCADGGDAVSIQLLATAPPGANLTWSLVSSVLPPGLTFSATGLISGTLQPTTGVYSFTVQVADSVSGLTCSQLILFQTSTNHPFDLCFWLRAPTAGYSAQGINTNTGVSGGNTACGGNVDGSGVFSFQYCTGSPGGRLLASSVCDINNLVGGFTCRLKIKFGPDFNANGDNFALTVVQDGNTLLSQTWCFPQGACSNAAVAGTTVYSNPFTIGTSNHISITLTYDSRDIRGDPSISGKLIGVSLCPQ